MVEFAGVPPRVSVTLVSSVFEIVPRDVTPVPPLPTGNVPDTSAVRLTAPQVGAPAAFPCRTVVVVPSEPRGVGVAPAPAPRTRALAVRATDDAITPAAVKPRIPPEVPDVIPVPPWDTAAVPEILENDGCADATTPDVEIDVTN